MEQISDIQLPVSFNRFNQARSDDSFSEEKVNGN